MAQQQKRQMMPGEKYLSISLGGKTGLKIALFKNQNKTKSTEPDYTGHIPIACWVSTKRAPEVKEEEII